MNQRLERYSGLIQRLAADAGLPPGLVAAIVEAESGGVPWAMRFEPGFHDRYIVDNPDYSSAGPTERIAAATSWGLMQVMGAVARERGFEGPYFSELCDPELGLRIGVAHLSGFVSRYEDLPAAVAAYNAGSPRIRDGRFVNQPYVNKVFALFDAYRDLGL